jgi:hypothetical protein
MNNPRRVSKGSRADLLVSLSLLLLSAAFVHFSLQMERPRGWLSAPGLLPLFLGVGLFVMAAFIAGAAIGRGAFSPRGRGTNEGGIPQWFKMSISRRVLLAAGVIALYFFGLLEFLPFEAATVIYFLLATAIFWPGSSWRQRATLAIGLTAASAISFRLFFSVLLPGEGDLLGNLLFWLRR